MRCCHFATQCHFAPNKSCFILSSYQLWHLPLLNQNGVKIQKRDTWLYFNHMQWFCYLLCQSNLRQNASKLIYQKGEIGFICQILTMWLIASLISKYGAELAAQWTHDVIMTSLLRQNGVATSFWRDNDVIITSCVRWAVTKFKWMWK